MVWALYMACYYKVYQLNFFNFFIPQSTNFNKVLTCCLVKVCLQTIYVNKAWSCNNNPQGWYKCYVEDMPRKVVK